MDLVYFADNFPDIAKYETRLFHILKEHKNGLPIGEYYIYEYYCTDSKCNCNKVRLNIVANDNTTSSFDYCWESLSFYKKWVLREKDENAPLIGLNKNVMIKQPFYIKEMEETLKYILEDKKYTKRLKRHYHMMQEINNDDDDKGNFDMENIKGINIDKEGGIIYLGDELDFDSENKQLSNSEKKLKIKKKNKKKLAKKNRKKTKK